MMNEKIIETVKPLLSGIKVTDCVIGLSMIGIELSDGHVGLSYVLRENIKSGCSIFPYAGDVIGQDAFEIAKWLVSGKDDVQRGIGMATITAVSRALNLESSELPFGLKVKSTDKVAMIGYIRPVAKMLSDKVGEINIFDEGISLKGGEKEKILPNEDQASVLPACDVVILSGTTLINGSFDALYKLCKNAREIMIMGSSCPMLPDAFKETKVSVLAGAWWKESEKEAIFKTISLAGGIQQLSPYMIKMNVRV